MENTDFNFNYAECLKSKNNLGETSYYNICNNETHKVEWVLWNGQMVLLLL